MKVEVSRCVSEHGIYRILTLALCNNGCHRRRRCRRQSARAVSMLHVSVAFSKDLVLQGYLPRCRGHSSPEVRVAVR